MYMNYAFRGNCWISGGRDLVADIYFIPLHPYGSSGTTIWTKGMDLAQGPEFDDRILLTDCETMWFLRLCIHQIVKYRPCRNCRIVKCQRFNGRSIENGDSADVGKDRGTRIFCGYCDPQRCSRNLLVSKNQTFQWNIQCTAGCRQIYVIFIQRFEQIRCCDIVSRGFEIQIVCEKCIFNYGDYGCLPVVTFFALYTFFPSVTRLWLEWISFILDFDIL